ncbi:MAG: inorganic phosphate transporter [Candidatus Sericytochromatia bacterium]
MPDYFILLVFVVILALIFDFINGFHDTANSIATVVSTRVLRPSQAVIMAAILNLLGAFIGIEVAKTIGVGIVELSSISQITVISALISGIIWNLLTWYYGIPSSSSHAIIGGLCGSAFAYGGMSAIKLEGLWKKIFLPMISSPVIGIVLGFIVMSILYNLLRKVRPSKVNKTFSFLQLVSAGFMAMSHGQNDAQKTMGIITLALISYNVFSASNISDKMENKVSSNTNNVYVEKTSKKNDILAFINEGGFIVHEKDGSYKAYKAKLKEGSNKKSQNKEDFNLTEVKTLDSNTVQELHKSFTKKDLEVGKDYKLDFSVPLWVIISCAVAMGLGTLSGGWKIIHTMGSKMIKLRPIHGFAAETSAALMIQGASFLGMPVSTTHIISTSIMGVGAAKRINAVKWGVVKSIVWAWVLTFPISFVLGVLSYKILTAFF